MAGCFQRAAGGVVSDAGPGKEAGVAKAPNKKFKRTLAPLVPLNLALCGLVHSSFYFGNIGAKARNKSEPAGVKVLALFPSCNASLSSMLILKFGRSWQEGSHLFPRATPA